jgi:hypothetical protein
MPELIRIEGPPRDNGVAMIGYSYGNFPELDFLGDSNLYEYGTLIVDPNTINHELEQTGGPPFRASAHWRFVRRIEELSTWISDGHSLIVLVTVPMVWQFEYMEENLPTTDQQSLYATPIFDGLEFQRATGNRIEYVGPASSEAIIRPHLTRLYYQAIVSGSQIQPLLQVRRRTPGGRQLVGCVHPYYSGRVICMPLLDGDTDGTAEYIRSLGELPASLLKQKDPLPDWIDSFRTKQELNCLNEVEKLLQKIKAKQSLLAREEKVIAGIREWKALFAGSGEEFKETVKEALKELGLRCVDGPPSRADLLASDGKRVIAVEAKGLESSAREKNFRQVQSWKAEVDLALTVDPEDVAENPDLKRYVEQLGLIGVAGKTADDCKGLIVIGTFGNIPLNERKMPDFPDNVTRSLIQSDVCAVTGLQLFGLVLQARSNPGSRANIVASLFETAGVSDMASNWHEFLMQWQA